MQVAENMSVNSYRFGCQFMYIPAGSASYKTGFKDEKNVQLQEKWVKVISTSVEECLEKKFLRQKRGK